MYMRFQLTTAILKPDLYCRPKAKEAVLSDIINNGLYIVKSKELKWSIKDAESFYKEHKGKFFYTRLITFMSSFPLCPLLLAGGDAIQTWRRLLGPTKSYIARVTAPATIRGRFGLTDTRNSVHGADSPANVDRELEFLFPEFNVTKWFDEEERHFRAGKVNYCPSKCCHVVKE